MDCQRDIIEIILMLRNKYLIPNYIMSEKKLLEIKHVADLLDMHFHIPAYQRGYNPYHRRHTGLCVQHQE